MSRYIVKYGRRDAVIERWCSEHGKTKDKLTMAEILEIRTLPEWKNALTDARSSEQE